MQLWDVPLCTWPAHVCAGCPQRPVLNGRGACRQAIGTVFPPLIRLHEKQRQSFADTAFFHGAWTMGLNESPGRPVLRGRDALAFLGEIAGGPCVFPGPRMSKLGRC